MKRRTWVYVMEPQAYEISCDHCDGSNIAWSEYEHMIWCYDCQVDTIGNGGIFDGPISMGLCGLLGISFDRWNLRKNRLEYWKRRGHKIIWIAAPILDYQDAEMKLEASD